MSESGASGVSLGNDSPLVESDKVILLVDDKIFHTTKETLVEKSTFFASRLLGPLHPSTTLTLNMDPVIFSHVLRYLRHGVLPFFYDQVRGFDHNLYSLVLAQADSLCIERLSSWIRDRRYLSTVKKERSAKLYSDLVDDMTSSDSADTECEYRFFQSKKRVYCCPRGIPVHHAPSDCGKQCNNVRGDAPWYHDKDQLQRVEIKTKTVFDRQACLEGQLDTTLNP